MEVKYDWFNNAVLGFKFGSNNNDDRYEEYSVKKRADGRFFVYEKNRCKGTRRTVIDSKTGKILSENKLEEAFV